MGKHICVLYSKGTTLSPFYSPLYFYPCQTRHWLWQEQQIWGRGGGEGGREEQGMLQGSLRITGVIKGNFLACCFCLFNHSVSTELANSLTQQVLLGNVGGGEEEKNSYSMEALFNITAFPQTFFLLFQANSRCLGASVVKAVMGGFCTEKQRKHFRVNNTRHLECQLWRAWAAHGQEGHRNQNNPSETLSPFPGFVFVVAFEAALTTGDYMDVQFSWRHV